MSSDRIRVAEEFRESLMNDDAWAWAIHSQIAVSFMDEGAEHEQANRAAARAMRLLFDVDVTKCDQWKSFPWAKDGESKTLAQPILAWFEYEHLRSDLQAVSKPFSDLAEKLCQMSHPGAERTVALRKLLEAKDAAVRSVIKPGF